MSRLSRTKTSLCGNQPMASKNKGNSDRLSFILNVGNYTPMHLDSIHKQNHTVIREILRVSSYRRGCFVARRLFFQVFVSSNAADLAFAL